MGLIEIILIIVGAVVLIISHVVPAGKMDGNATQAPKIDEKMIRDLVEKEIGGAKSHINDMVDETLSYSMEKTERAMERLTNEKIMAINEYSDQVLNAINKNHQEVMFLYDMLNDKHENLVNTVSEASRRAKEIKQTVRDAEVTVKEAVGMITEDAGIITGNIENTEKKENADGKPAAAEAAGRKAGNSEIDDVDKSAAEQDENTEFIPIAPKRVELVQGVIKEDETVSAEDNRELFHGLEPEDEKNYNNNDQILRLHKLGKSKTAIAKELGLGVGEVKLVIDLFEQ